MSASTSDLHLRDIATETMPMHGHLDPRQAMAKALPAWLQPFLTWLTARPMPGEAVGTPSPHRFVAGAVGWTSLGFGTAYAALCLAPTALSLVLVPIGLLLSCFGLGLCQVVVFHHASHGTVFKTRERNRFVGRLISATLLFKRFDDYQREHMLHHSPNKLLTEEDEFADFVLGLCRLHPGVDKTTLWRSVLSDLVSPQFHWRFLRRRIEVALFTGDAAHDWTGRAFWGTAFLAAAATGTLLPFLIAVVLPVTVLLQIATVFRILCEHRFPEPHLLAKRDRVFLSHATTGVFLGTVPPAQGAGIFAWVAWWAEMLTWHLFVRLFVLVGDAPCHDFHHRKPATRRWTSYIQARQADLDAGSPGFPAGYLESWGLINCLDSNLATLARTAPATIGR